MRIEHVALWVADLAKVRAFYERLGGVITDPPYHNPRTNFRSCFLAFGEGARLELMQRPDMIERSKGGLGYAHFALSLGSEEAVDHLTVALAAEGVTVLGGPRRTGDGYYESLISDPEGNRIELTA